MIAQAIDEVETAELPVLEFVAPMPGFPAHRKFVLVQTDEAFLKAQSMTKGSMQLIDEARAKAIYAAMGPATEISGGAAANTAVGVACFGARAGRSHLR